MIRRKWNRESFRRAVDLGTEATLHFLRVENLSFVCKAQSTRHRVRDDNVISNQRRSTQRKGLTGRYFRRATECSSLCHVEVIDVCCMKNSSRPRIPSEVSSCSKVTGEKWPRTKSSFPIVLLRLILSDSLLSIPMKIFWEIIINTIVMLELSGSCQENSFARYFEWIETFESPKTRRMDGENQSNEIYCANEMNNHHLEQYVLADWEDFQK